jgi:aminoacrylate hydrolase
MPTLHVESRGGGPLVVLLPGLWSPPATFTPLLVDLAAEHRVVTYDARGSGRSQRDGPYDLATDAADLAEIVAAHGPPATLIGTGAGANLGLHVLAVHPDLVEAVICPSGSPVYRAVATDDDSLAGSRSVYELLSEMAVRDYRGFLSSIVSSTNTQLDEAGVAERVALVVDYTPHEVMIERLRAWMADDAVTIARAAGNRLTVLLYGDDPWTPPGAAQATRELLPEAEVLEVDDGPLSRPDITAAVVRRRSGVAA